MREAAIFDLDRTLLVGASGPVLSDALQEAGLRSGSIPGERLLFEVFNRIGETLPSMAITRQGVALARGKSRLAVRRAAEAAAPRLAELVPAFARAEIERHRSENRLVVIATTTPRDLVEPFGSLLGFDDVIATTYEYDENDTYTGRLDGPFVWNSGKASAVRDWAIREGVELGNSYAYSDSVYDLPLLSAVGFPHAVNPDPRLQIVATARRWPVLHFDVSPGVVKVPVANVEVQRIALEFARPSMFPFTRFDIEGVENVPSEGPAILCGNHRSYFDVFAMALTVAKTGRTVRFLGKKEVFEAPVIGQLASAMGGIRVDRGTGSDQPLQFAEEALAAGEMVAIMPEGTIPRGPAFFDPVLKGRWGAARLAMATKAPVVPVGLWGTEKVWPRSSRIPHVLNVTNPPLVRVRVGRPIVLRGKQPEPATKRIMSAITTLLPDEARVKRTPSEAELLLTYPSGYSGDPERETSRRPGTD